MGRYLYVLRTDEGGSGPNMLRPSVANYAAFGLGNPLFGDSGRWFPFGDSLVHGGSLAIDLLPVPTDLGQDLRWSIPMLQGCSMPNGTNQPP